MTPLEPNPLEPPPSNNRPLLILLGVGLMLLAVTGAAGVTAFFFLSRSPEMRALPTQLARALVEPTTTTPPRVGSGWPVVLEDDFSREAYAWERGQDSGRYADGSLYVADGRYHLDITAKQGVLWWSLVDEYRTADDVYLQVEAEKLSTPEVSGDYGLILRFNLYDYYYFEVDPEAGQFALQIYYHGTWSPIIDWTDSPAIRAQGPNQLTAQLQGARFTLYINGEFVAEAEDGRVPRGAMGVGVQVHTAGQTGRYAFDNFAWRSPAGAVQSLPTETPAATPR